MLTALAAGGAAAATALATRTIDAGALAGTFARTNHAGASVSLSEGVGLAAGTLATALITRDDAALLAAAAGAGFGALDDHRESGNAKGLKGHLRSLARGKLTTGGAKLVGISAAAGLAALMIGRDRDVRGLARLMDAGVDAALIAGSANFINLLDLRPGRALKGAGALAALAALLAEDRGAIRADIAGLAATIVTAAPADLAGEKMMGDTGANALGAAIGVLLARGMSRPVRVAAASAIVGLILASERVSFSAVIEANPALSAIDMWGRG